MWSVKGCFVVLVLARKVSAALFLTKRSCESRTCANAARISAFFITWLNKFVFGPDETVTESGNVGAGGAWAPVGLGRSPHTPARTTRMDTSFHARERVIDLRAR